MVIPGQDPNIVAIAAHKSVTAAFRKLHDQLSVDPNNIIIALYFHCPKHPANLKLNTFLLRHQAPYRTLTRTKDKKVFINGIVSHFEGLSLSKFFTHQKDRTFQPATQREKYLSLTRKICRNKAEQLNKPSEDDGAIPNAAPIVQMEGVPHIPPVVDHYNEPQADKKEDNFDLPLPNLGAGPEEQELFTGRLFPTSNGKNQAC